MNGLTVNAPHGEKDTEARFGFQVAPLYKDSEGIPRHLAVLLFFGVLGPPADCRWRTSAEGSLSDLLKVGFLPEGIKTHKIRRREKTGGF